MTGQDAAKRAEEVIQEIARNAASECWMRCFDVLDEYVDAAVAEAVKERDARIKHLEEQLRDPRVGGGDRW